MDILTTMFALSSEQVTLLKHYAFNEEGQLILANIDMSSRLITRKEGIVDLRFEKIDFIEDKLTQNIVLNLHIKNGSEAKEILVKDNSYYVLGMKKSPRSGKLILTIKWGGYND